MRTALSLTTVLGFCLLVGCSGTEPSAAIAPTKDAGAARDAGTAAPRDAGTTTDAGTATDAGFTNDAGSATDAGSTPDARPLLETWFENYNEGQGTDYLDAPHTTNANGDPRYPNAPAHVHRQDVSYGPFERNVLDLWAVDTATPTPIAVYIHGGGFQGGSKNNVHRNQQQIPRLLAAGVSVASINYRWAYRDPDAAVMAPIPNDEGSIHDVNGTRLDYILRDCARAIQFLRYRAAEWNLDASRIGAWGGSAGAGCVVWVGTVGELAVEDHADPVLRESSALSVMVHTNGQPTYNMPRWPKLLSLDETFVFDNIGTEAVRLTQLSLEDLAVADDLNTILDYYEHLGPGDPPFFTVNANPDVDEMTTMNAGQIIHHPRGHVVLYERCVAAGLAACEIQTRIEDSGYGGGAIDFLIEHLTP